MEQCDAAFLLDNVVQSLRQALGARLVGLVLFGSRARGDARESSDWDVLVIARDLPERTLERYWLVKRALPVLWRGAVSVLAKTPEEIEAGIAPLFLDIALDGQILWDPYGYAVRWLADLKDLLQRKGLRRERTAAGDIWRWEIEPVGEWSLDLGA